MEHNKNNPKLIRDVITDAARKGKLQIVNCNLYLLDEELSLKAKGLLTMALDMQSRDDAYIIPAQLRISCKETVYGILDTIYELLEKSYCSAAPNQENKNPLDRKFFFSPYKL